MDSVKELAKQIAGYIKGKKTRAYDTAAEVRRIVGNTAYVHIPGGVPETPVKLTIDAKVGDTVQVRVANSTAWLVGNSTAPPTDDTKAKEADANAGKAMNKAKEAETIAEEGLKEAKGTSNYFWHVDGSGSESGAHVTEIPQKEFEENPSGGNLLMQASAVRIRRALRTYAMFSSEGMAIDPSRGLHTTYGADSIQYNYGGAKSEVSFGAETGSGKFFTKILSHIPLTSKDVDSSIEVLSNSLDTSQSSITMRTGYSTYPRQEFIMKNGKFDMRALQTEGATNKYFTVDLDNGVSTDQPIESTEKGTFWGLDIKGELRGITEPISISRSNFTVTTGSISSVAMMRFGNVVQLTMTVTKTTTTAAGNDMFVGVLNLTDYRPKMTIECGSYSGTIALVGRMQPNGTINVNVTGAQLAADRSPILTFTYLI